MLQNELLVLRCQICIDKAENGPRHVCCMIRLASPEYDLFLSLIPADVSNYKTDSDESFGIVHRAKSVVEFVDSVFILEQIADVAERIICIHLNFMLTIEI